MIDATALMLLIAAADTLSNVVGGFFALRRPPPSLFTSIAGGFSIATISLETIPQAIELATECGFLDILIHAHVL